ncbi:MAG: hypothetical protein MMC33_005004 [Icmadophila ericetorum]|nr:hypothetical protein [Icmadophila ericetorum]
MSKGPKKSGWSESEKLALLFSLMDTAGTIDWKRAVVPEGRTLKAAQLQFYEWKKLASAGSNGTAGESPSATPRKRKQAKKISDNNGVDDKEEGTPKKPKRGKVKAETKEEAAATESEAEWDGEEA